MTGSLLQFRPAQTERSIPIDRIITTGPPSPEIAGLDPPRPDVTILVALTIEEGSSLMPKSTVPISLGESPLTDPRSLGSSASFHVLVVLLASLTALNVALPLTASRPKALYAEIDPVDNRADVPSSPGQGGGSPGRYRRNEQFAVHSAVGWDESTGRDRDPVADTLLAEILPSSSAQAEASQFSVPCQARRRPARGSFPAQVWRRGRRGRGFRRRCRPWHRARDPVFWRARSCSFLRLRDRLLRQHGHAKFARSCQA